MKKECANCEHETLDILYEPCLSCKDYSAWESKGCATCKYETLFANEAPCRACTNAWSSGDECKWEPKEQEEDMGEKAYTMTFTTAEINDDALKTITGETEPDYKEELEEANRNIRRLENEIHDRALDQARKAGMIEGLKFAIRCNGVSGGEVR